MTNIDPQAGVTVVEQDVGAGTLPPGVKPYQVNIRFEDGEIEKDGKKMPLSRVVGFPVLAETSEQAVKIIHGHLLKCVEKVEIYEKS